MGKLFNTNIYCCISVWTYLFYYFVSFAGGALMASTKSNFGKILQLHNIRRNYIAWLCNLAQLNSGYCTSLNSYLSRNDKDVPNLCPVRNESPLDYNLFACPMKPTHLTGFILFPHPVQTAHLLGLLDEFADNQLVLCYPNKLWINL